MSLPLYDQALEDFCSDYSGTYELRYISEDGEVMAKVTGYSTDSVIEQTNKLELAVAKAIEEEYYNKYETDYDSWAKEERILTDGI